MPKLIDCVRGHLSEGDWYLWWDEQQEIWQTGRCVRYEDKTLGLMFADGATTDVEWVGYKGYRIVHK
jgi:hypothetical protein